MKKGFARILEAILASVVMLTILAYFFNQGHISSNWSYTITRLQAHDMIASMYLTGELQKYVRDDDYTALNGRISRIFPDTIGYSVEINGIPNPIIYVTHSCSGKNFENILYPTDFNYSMRNISIRLKTLTTSFNEMDSRTNIFITCDYSDLVSQKDYINKFLEKGGTIFLFSDIGSDINDNSENSKYVRYIFNLTWKGSVSSSNPEFYDVYDPEKPSYYIAKYYRNITGISQKPSFFGFHNSEIATNEKTVVFSIHDNVSFVQVNYYIINGKGYAVWFNNYDNNQNTNDLFKAAVMWASGRSYKMDSYTKNTGPVYSYATYIVSGHDSFEPFEVNLIFWRIFY